MSKQRKDDSNAVPTFSASEAQQILTIAARIETRYAEQFKKYKFTRRHALAVALDVIVFADDVNVCVKHDECITRVIELHAALMSQIAPSFKQYVSESLDDVIDIAALERELTRHLQ